MKRILSAVLVGLLLMPVAWAPNAAADDAVVEAQAAEGALGLTREQRRQIQEALAARGFDVGPADGSFGPRTREAIRAWQHGMYTSGSKRVTGYLHTSQAQLLLGDAEAAGESRRSIRPRQSSGGVSEAAQSPPGPACLGAKVGTSCWHTVMLNGRERCSVWDKYLSRAETITAMLSVRGAAFRATCVGGKVQGQVNVQGTLRWKMSTGDVETIRFCNQGGYVDGKASGHWQEILFITSGKVEDMACPYFDTHGPIVLEVFDFWETREGHYDNGLEDGEWSVRVNDEDLAYCVYTSGDLDKRGSESSCPYL